MSEVINSLHAVRRGNKWFVAGGGGAGSPIHTFNSVDEMNAANLADGSIACVPSEGDVKVIDLTKYIVTESSTLNDLVLNAFSAGGGAITFDDSSSFWADVNTNENIKLKLDISALANNTIIEAVPSYIMKQNDTIVAIQITTIVNGGAYMRGSIVFETYVTGRTKMAMHVETLDIQEQ